MKVIDLLNKIANGEEVPEEIKVREYTFHFDSSDDNEFYYYKTMSNDLITDIVYLNDEVETIEEEHKIPEKLKIGVNVCDEIQINNEIYGERQVREVADKVNEIIDYLKENK